MWVVSNSRSTLPSVFRAEARERTRPLALRADVRVPIRMSDTSRRREIAVTRAAEDATQVGESKARMATSWSTPNREELDEELDDGSCARRDAL